MWTETIIECHYVNGERGFAILSKYMNRQGLGRPVKVIVTGPVTPADINAIRNSAAIGAEIVYLD